MIEVHLMRLEPLAAIGARDAAKITQQLDHPGLSDSDPLDFEVTIPPVVLDVVRSLARTNSH